MSTNEKRIAKLIGFVNGKGAGFAVKRAVVDSKTGEIKIVQTTRNANEGSLEKKHSAIMLKIKRDVLKDTEIVFAIAAEKSNGIKRTITRLQEFVQLVGVGVPMYKAFEYSQM